MLTSLSLVNLIDDEFKFYIITFSEPYGIPTFTYFYKYSTFSEGTNQTGRDFFSFTLVSRMGKVGRGNVYKSLHN